MEISEVDRGKEKMNQDTVHEACPYRPYGLLRPRVLRNNAGLDEKYAKVSENGGFTITEKKGA
jgi:hypothetical protein